MEQAKIAIQDVYPDDLARCNDCGRLNDDRYHFRKFWNGLKW